jgi:hypothetical protein
MTDRSVATLDEQTISEQYPDLYTLLIPLLRTKSDDLDAYLELVACDAVISNTYTRAHCYFIALDGNKRPRVKDFARFIANRIVDFAIPRVEIIRAFNDSLRTGSSAPIVSLNKKATNLFTKLPQSGEGGEVLLSILAETFLRLPQLFTKMVLKTSGEMHVHGSDGIHVGVNDRNGNLSIYWGESKLYKNAAAAVNQCFSSLAPFLLNAGGSGGEQERDLQLMRDGLSLDDPNLLAALKRYLNPDDPMFKRLEYRGLCLVGFDSDSYPTSPNSKEAHQVKTEIETAFEKNKTQILNRVTTEKIESFVIEIFCLPFPRVDEFREAFRAELGFSSEQS